MSLCRHVMPCGSNQEAANALRVQKQRRAQAEDFVGVHDIRDGYI
jgi:hypothetical protein